MLPFVLAGELHFDLFARHGTISSDLAAQGVTLFLSIRTGIDFTRWNVTVFEAPSKYRDDGVGLEVIVDVPDSMISRVNNDVKSYISSGALNADFAREGIEDIKISLLPDAPSPSPSFSASTVSKSPLPSRLPVASSTPKTLPEELEGPSNEPMKSSDMLYFSSPEPSYEVMASAFAVVSTEMEEFEEQQEDILLETKSDSSPPSVSAVSDTVFDTSSPLDEQLGSAASSDLAERDVELAPGDTLSELLVLSVQSPVFGFPADLRDALKWFIAKDTDTSVNKWYLWDLIERVDGSYLALLRFAGPPSSHDLKLKNAKRYVNRGGLANSLLNVGDGGQFAVFVVDATEIDPEGSFEPIPIRFDPMASPVAKPTLGPDQKLLPLGLNVSSPVIGFGNKLEAGIAQFGAQETNMLVGDWALQSTSESEIFGEFNVMYLLRVHKNRIRDISGTIIKIVRDREMDSHLDSLGFENVQVRLLPRLLNSTADYDNDKAGKRGELRSSAGTIAASVVGILAVIAIGVAVFLLCLPKGRASRAT